MWSQTHNDCTEKCDALNSRLEDIVDELEEEGEKEEAGGGGESVDEAEVVHVVAVLGVNLQGCQEPETKWRGFVLTVMEVDPTLLT